MLNGLIELVKSEVSGGRTMDCIRKLHAIDRWFTYPKFLESAALCQQILKDYGVDDARVEKFKADGKTFYGAWRVPMAWDAGEARLSIVSTDSANGKVIADRANCPCSLVMWSGPTPNEGITAEAVEVGGGSTEEDYKGRNIKGKIVLINTRARVAKRLAARYGAIGIVTDWNPRPEHLPDAVFWNNAFADSPESWGPANRDSQLFAFSVSPNTGRELRAILKKQQRLTLHAKVDARLYAGELPITTGVIKGKPGTEEVLLLGHGFEQGACDNASGIACMLEAMRILSRLIIQKKLPQPQRSIRFLMTNECFGTLGYVEKYPGRIGKTVAGLCLDSCGIDIEDEDATLSLFRNPLSNTSYLDTFAEDLANSAWGHGNRSNPWRMQPYSMSDNLIAHKTIDIPTIWIGRGNNNQVWHTSADTPDRISPEQMAEVATYAACYIYFLASAGEEEAIWLAKRSTAALRCHIAQIDADAAPVQNMQEFADDMDFLSRISRHAVERTGELAPGSQELGSIIDKLGCRIKEETSSIIDKVTLGIEPTSLLRRSGIVPIPKYIGPITFDALPETQKPDYSDPRWGGAVNMALAWADGERTLDEIVRLVELETKMEYPGLAREICYLIECGMVETS